MGAVINRKNGNTSVIVNRAVEDPGDWKMLNYALSAYAFVLPLNGEFTFEDWIKAIKTTVDEYNPANLTIIKFIKKYS